MEATASQVRLAGGQARFCVLTSPGRGAIATIGVSGKRAVEIVGRLFSPASGRPLTPSAVGEAIFGRFHSSAAAEELVVGIVSASEVEIHCHGGQAAVAAICDALLVDGCNLVSHEKWAAARETNLIAAETLLALAAAPTERAAGILLDQYRGALRSELFAIERSLNEGRAELTAKVVQDLVARADFGLHLTKPWRIVIAGEPNAGKSSLINALLGYERAIVYHEPGTTRDVLTATTAIDGWPVELADTAGLRSTSNALEEKGIARARREVEQADAVVFVIDSTMAWNDSVFRAISTARKRLDSEVVGHSPDPRLLVVHNKSDLATLPNDGRPPGITISATTGAGVDLACAELAKTLVPNPPPAGAPVPFTTRHIAALRVIATQLSQVEIDAARRELKGLIS